MPASVADVFKYTPQVASFASCTQTQVTKPYSSFVLMPHEQYCQWGYPIPRQQCSLAKSMGKLADLYGFDKRHTWWAPNCWNLDCPPATGQCGGYTCGRLPA